MKSIYSAYDTTPRRQVLPNSLPSVKGTILMTRRFNHMRPLGV